jgi:hypothetical protein
MKRVATDRVASAAFAVLLQVGFVAMLIYSLPLFSPPKKLVREITFFLRPVRETPTPATAPRSLGPSAASPFLNIPRVEIPPIEIPPVGVAPPAADLQQFGNTLFGCAPENLGNLTAEQRAHCNVVRIAPPDDSVVTEAASHVQDPTRRAAELAGRNTPARVPCTSILSHSLGFTGKEDIGVMANSLCVLNGLFNGFGGLPP